MSARVSALVAVLLLAALPLAGCLGAPASPAQGAGAPAPGDAPARGEPANGFLVDAPRPPGASVSRGAEPMILVGEGGTLFVGDTSGVHRSRDGGATWQALREPFVRGFFTDGRALAMDDAGTLYVAATNGQAISIAASDDEGDTWRLVNHLADAATVADRPWLAARGDGEVALVFYDWGRTNTEQCLFSTDGGATFLRRSLGNLYASANAGNVEFAPDGSLYYSTGRMTYRWAQPCDGAFSRIPNGAMGAQIFTQIQVDDAGRTYIARPSADNGAMTVDGMVGLDGATRKRVVVSPPALASNTFGTISVHGDEVAVAWYGSETLGDPSSATFDGEWNVFVARVAGFWTDSPTITYTRVTTEPNHVGGFCMGGVGCGATAKGDRDLLDYFMLDHAQDGTLHVAYGHDGAGSRAEVRHAAIAP